MTNIAATVIRVLLVVYGALLACGPMSHAQERGPLDVLVVAPHPDDEIIGCAGVILQALAEHQRVGMVILTNGDAHVALTAVVAKKDKGQLVPDDLSLIHI